MLAWRPRHGLRVGSGPGGPKGRGRPPGLPAAARGAPRARADAPGPGRALGGGRRRTEHAGGLDRERVSTPAAPAARAERRGPQLRVRAGLELSAHADLVVPPGLHRRGVAACASEVEQFDHRKGWRAGLWQHGLARRAERPNLALLVVPARGRAASGKHALGGLRARLGGARGRLRGCDELLFVRCDVRLYRAGQPHRHRVAGLPSERVLCFGRRRHGGGCGRHLLDVGPVG
mmetsp:Transcript_4871/g.14627  ORF Transcript_4871/g.14627 Transcript_4871/m.14627 type:complete len:233 (+) Transcript_4871:640-1338(+)